LGKLFGEAIHKVGESGVVTVEENDSVGTHLDLVEGLEIDKGWISPYFVTDRMNAILYLGEAIHPLHGLQDQQSSGASSCS